MPARPTPVRPLSWPWSSRNTAITRPPFVEERRQSIELYSVDVFNFLLINSLVLASLVGEENVLQAQEKLIEAVSAVPWHLFSPKWETGKHETYLDIWSSYNKNASQASEAGPRLFELVTVHAIAPAQTGQAHFEPVPESTSMSRKSVRAHSAWSEKIAIPEGGVEFYHHTPLQSGHCGRIPYGVGGKRTTIEALLGFFKCVRSHRAQGVDVDSITLYGATQDGANYVLLKLTPDGAFYQHTIRLVVGGNDTF